ncbi:hypothetical protein ATSB10_21080 [Dyella thiooxydans]|uniref:Uncharacterized protein n=1 Tax=Dyella thiooxydans TaxID=445710 RepID=A0A160N2N5_9GAMM|nr:hypothetical protein [Dyella thiooxydans]AND69562.1 hypothetical protein ATSB10_21080 [Dyella thiooxydans]
MRHTKLPPMLRAWPLYLAMLVTACVYWPGLSGGWLFDDYPNIVDNHGVQPDHASVATLTRAALSSPSSQFKRPLSSLTFAANYLAAGLDPFWMKVTNLLIHLLNGALVFALSRRLLRCASPDDPGDPARETILAGLIAAAWLLLPVNLTGVLYVVQRMESLANLFVLMGLLGYVAGRQRMLEGRTTSGLWLCCASVIAGTAIGLTAKETAAMLPLYAALAEWVLFDFRDHQRRRSLPVLGLFVVTLLLPLVLGLAWLLPGLLQPATWATRDFTLRTRLLSEARIVTDYIGWTLAPTPGDLSFYHDDFHVSQGWLQPWTTLPSALVLVSLGWIAVRLRRRYPLASLGIALFLGCHLLTGTILPLELIYEHRNYFASFGLLLAVIPALAAMPASAARPPFALTRRALLGALLAWWALLTAMTAQAWGNPLSLAVELADRAPHSPRAQYELGRTYIIYSRYDPESRFTRLAYAPLERAMKLPDSSILPEQALIFMNSRMHLPIKDAWWDSLIGKLRARKPGVQDESSLAALTQCARDGRCPLPPEKMVAAFQAAISHAAPSPRLLSSYGDYAWNILKDHELAFRMAKAASAADPHEPAYRITLAREALALDQVSEARIQIRELEKLDVAGSLDADIHELTAELPVDH